MNRALLIGLLALSSSAFAAAPDPELMRTIDLKQDDPASSHFYCSQAMTEALANKRNLAWNKVGVYSLRGLLFVAPIAAGGAVGGVVGYALAPIFADLGGLAGAVAGGCSIGDIPDPFSYVEEVIKTKEQKIIELKLLFEATIFTEKELMDSDFEKRIAESIAEEEKIRADRHLPALTENEKLTIRKVTSYGTREKTLIDALVRSISDSSAGKGPKIDYSAARQLVLDHGHTEEFCPLAKNGKRHKFLSMRKIVKNFRKTLAKNETL